MPVVRLRHVHKLLHRDGRPRYLLRIPGRKAITLPGMPGSPEFMAAYHRGIGSVAAPAKGPVPGSLNALAISYYGSPAFKALKSPTQASYRRLVEEMRVNYGTGPVRLLQPQHIEAMMAEKSAHPTAANHRLRLLRALMTHAKMLKWISADPTLGVKRVAYRTDGYHTWTEAEIAAFEARWPTGTRERLAFALLLYTGQRRSDVVRMGRHHMREVPIDGRPVKLIEVVHEKTGNRLLLPIHPNLAAEIDLAPIDLRGTLPYLRTAFRKPFSPRGFYNLFVSWAQEAGLPAGCSPHGLRKAAGRRLAEAGATTHQIMSILGVTLETAEIYTRQAEQMRMAVAGMARILA
jgi:integrase